MIQFAVCKIWPISELTVLIHIGNEGYTLSYACIRACIRISLREFVTPYSMS